MRKVFISYHHKNEQYVKEHLLQFNYIHEIFEDCSVSTGDINDTLEPQQIRQTIRRNYLSGSTVLLLIVGQETRYRKHVDWELYSSMHNGPKFGRSGVVVLQAPGAESTYFTAPFDEIKKNLYPHVTSWINLDSRAEYEERYPHMPPRIIDCLSAGNDNISISNWSNVMDDPNKLKLLIECAHNSRLHSEYDLSRPMRMKDFNP